MKVYLVGGAVRDMLLNRPIEERDWVVVGETPDSMLQQGFALSSCECIFFFGFWM